MLNAVSFADILDLTFKVKITPVFLKSLETTGAISATRDADSVFKNYAKTKSTASVPDVSPLPDVSFLSLTSTAKGVPANSKL